MPKEYPRAWVDLTVPDDEFGNPITSTRTDAEYRQYVEWLADYLFETDIPVPDNQRELVEEFADSQPSSTLFWLSEEIGFESDYISSLESYAAQGNDYNGYLKEKKEIWDEYSPEEKEGSSFEDFCTSKEKYERIAGEWKEKARVPVDLRHADIPYRAVIAAALKRVPERKERVMMLYTFYELIIENYSK